MRTAEIIRKTKETDIILKLELDGKGKGSIDSGCGFLDHMLTLFAAHSRCDLSVICDGDTYVDDHSYFSWSVCRCKDDGGARTMAGYADISAYNQCPLLIYVHCFIAKIE